MAKILLVLIISVVLFVSIRKLERVNLRYQVEKKLASDPAVSPTVAKLKEAIEKNLRANVSPQQAEQERLVVALYHGQVREFAQGKEVSGMPATQVLHLEKPILLAGEPGKNDSAESVLISYKNYPAGRERPAKGQKWIVAVWRDRSGNNVFASAQRCAPE